VSEVQRKILIVDNEPLVVEELAEFLEGQGFKCLCSVRAGEALRLFHENPNIDIVLSDFRMPDMSGLELVEMLNSTTAKERIFETILFTGNADKEDVIAALRAGVADYYQKPLDLVQLLDGIKRLEEKLEKRHAQLKIRPINDKLRKLSTLLEEIYEGMDQVAEDAADHKGQNQQPEADNGIAVEGVSKLSPRQTDVAKLIVKGLTNYQIACELGISENTVKLYVSQILRATSLNNRTQLAMVLGGRQKGDLNILLR